MPIRSYLEAQEAGRELAQSMEFYGPNALSDARTRMYNRESEKKRVGLFETIGAFVEREIPFGDQILHGLAPPETGNGAWNIVTDPVFMSLADEDKRKVDDSEGPMELQWEIGKLNRMRRAKEALADSGVGAQLVAGVITAPLDPTFYVELLAGGGILRAAKIAKMGLAVRTAVASAEAAAAGWGAAGSRELLLNLDQHERTRREITANILWEGVFAAGLGGFGGALSRQAAREMAHGRLEVGHEVTGRVAELLGGVEAPTHAQYEDALVKALHERDGNFKIREANTIVGKVVRTPVSWFVKNVLRNPFGRGAMSDIEAARIGVAIYSDIPVSRVGVDPRLVRAGLDVAVKRKSGDMYVTIGKLNRVWKDLRGAGSAMEKDAFRKNVGRIMSYNDIADVRSLGDDFAKLSDVEVKALHDAAAQARKQVDAVHDLGVSVGAWARDPKLGDTALSYFTRIWDKELVRLDDLRVRALVEGYANKKNDELLARHGVDTLAELPDNVRIYSEHDIKLTIENMGGGRSRLGTHRQTKSVESSPMAPRDMDMPNNFEVNHPDIGTIRATDFMETDVNKVLEHTALFTVPDLLVAQRFATNGMRRMAITRVKIDDIVNRLERAQIEGDIPSIDTLTLQLDEASVRMHVAEVIDMLEVGGGSEEAISASIKTYENAAEELIETRKSIYKARRRVEAIDAAIEIAEAEQGSGRKKTKAELAKVDRLRKKQQAEMDALEAKVEVDDALTDQIARKNEELIEAEMEATTLQDKLSARKPLVDELDHLEREIDTNERTLAKLDAEIDSVLLAGEVPSPALSRKIAKKAHLEAEIAHSRDMMSAKEAEVASSVGFPSLAARRNAMLNLGHRSKQLSKELAELTGKRAPGSAKFRARIAKLKRLVDKKEARVDLDAEIKAAKAERVQANKVVLAHKSKHSKMRKTMELWEDEAHAGAIGTKSTIRLHSAPDPKIWRDAKKGEAARVTRHESAAAKQFAAFDRSRENVRLFNSMEQQRRDTLAASGLTGEARLKLAKKLEAQVTDARNTVRIMNLKTRNLHISQSSTRVEEWGEFILDLNYVTQMGGVMLSSIPDIVGSMAYLGMRDWFTGMVRHIGSETQRLLKKVPRDEIADFYNASDIISNTSRHDVLTGIDHANIRARNGKVARARRWSTKKTTQFNLSGWWNSQAKRLVAAQSQAKAIRVLKKGKLSAADADFFDAFGVNPDMITRFRDQLNEHGKRVGRLEDSQFELANVLEWTDAGAVEAWRDMIIGVGNSSVVTLGSADLAGGMNHILGRLLGQYKSFGMAFTSRVMLAGLSREHSQMVVTAMSIMYMGHLTQMAKDAVSGRDRSKDSDADMFFNALDRSGLLGSFMDANNTLLDPLSRGNLDIRAGLNAVTGETSGKAGGRMDARSTASRVVGPWYGTIEKGLNLTRGVLDMAQGEPLTQSVVTSGRQLTPLNNVAMFRVAFDRIIAPMITEGATHFEEAIAERLGIPKRRKRK